jgi:hypothetical protein
MGVGGFADWAGLAPERERFGSTATMVMARLNFIFMLLEARSLLVAALGDGFA